MSHHDSKTQTTPHGDSAAVHLRVPAATKARWVRESRAAGQRLTDWLLARIERGDTTPTITESGNGLPGVGHAIGLWMVEQSGEPIQEGQFQTEAGALRALESLVNDLGWDRTTLRVVHYTGNQAAAYASGL